MDIATEVDSLYWGCRSLAGNLSRGWSSPPPPPGTAAHNQLIRHRSRNQEKAAYLLEEWRSVRDRFPAKQAAEVDEVLNAVAGFVERQEPDPAAVKQIAEELRAAAGILKRAAPTGTDDAQATDTQAPELNDTERTICEAINQLWADGHEWPGARVIADKSGYVEQTVKNTVAHLVRSKALAKGENGRGYKVRT